MRDLTMMREAERERTLRIVELSARQEAERSLAQLMEIFENIADPIFCLDAAGSCRAKYKEFRNHFRGN